MLHCERLGVLYYTVKPLDTFPTPTYYRVMEHRAHKECVVCGFRGGLLLVKADETVALGLAVEPVAVWSCLVHYFAARASVENEQKVVEYVKPDYTGLEMAS